MKQVGRKRSGGGWRFLIKLLLILPAAVGLLWFFLPIPLYFVMNVGNLAGLIACGGWIALVTFWERAAARLKAGTKKKWQKAVAAMLCLCLFCGIGASGWALAAILAGAGGKPGSAQTAVVLGCQVKGTLPGRMLRQRIDAAYAFLSEDPQAVCVLSGGQGPDEGVSEAQCMYNALVDAGVDPARLYREDASTSTEENIRFSLDVIRENGLSEPICLISSEFHLCRALMIAAKYTDNASAAPSRSSVILLPTYVSREVFAVLKTRFIG